MTSPKSKERRVLANVPPPAKTQWEFVVDLQDRLERVERLFCRLTEGDEADTALEETELLFHYLSFPSVLSDVSSDRLCVARRRQAYGKWSKWLHVTWSPFDAAAHLSEPRIINREQHVHPAGERLAHQSEKLASAAESFLRDFDDPMARINRHTELCQASRRLRESARAERNTPFYWALVDLDDCIRATAPEEMTPRMADTLCRCITRLSPTMSEEEMLGITDDLFNAGLRTWRPKKTQRRKKAKSGSRS